MKPKFKKNQIVQFDLGNNLKSNNATISAICDTNAAEPIYIIKHTTGWKPTTQLINKYLLDANSRYLFVQESQIIG